MTISSISSVLIVAILSLSINSKAHVPENEQIEEAFPGYCNLLKTKDVDLKGKMRVYGEIKASNGIRPLEAPIIVSVNKRVVDTVTNGLFELQFSPGAKIKNISFRSLYGRYHTMSSGKIAFQANKSLKYEVGLEEYVREIMTEKPVIYLYSDEDREVDLNLNINGQLKFSYPEYKNGWTCTARSDGSIEVNGQSYDYLFYDAAITLEAYRPHEGFVVAGRDVITFLETNLAKIGLNASERNDFITYWAPRMVKNEFNHVQFLINEDYDAISTIDVSPKPETSIRLHMFFQKVKADHTVIDQELQVSERKGFTLIEWGGTEIKSSKKAL